MKLKKFIETTIREYLIESSDNYKTWKRKNVTLRGIKELGKTNDVYGSFGKGLYTVPLSNKVMAKQYGDVYFVINSIPKNPKVVDSLNNAEIVRQNIINDFCKKHGKDYDPSFFESQTTMDVEMLNAGYDGIVIKGREIVNYKPINVKYFKTEDELQKYYSTINERLNESILDKSLGNKNLLYHSTSFNNLLEILNDNVLYGTDTYDYGIATSRNKNYLFYINDYGEIKSGEGECQLILDRDKIKNNYRIEPFDWEEYKRRNDKNYHQSEDKILTSKIINIKKYIVGIHLNKKVNNNYTKLLKKESDFLIDNNIIIFGRDWDILKSF